MDYSHAAYFSGSQPYQFMGIPPLTPSHSNSAPSEDYNTTSPPEVYSEFSTGNENYQNFDTYQQFTQQYPGPPTPPNQHPAVHGAAAAAVAAPQLNGVPNGAVKTHPAEMLPLTKTEPGLLDPQAQRGGSNSDEDDLTPAQSRRKAQNRAAQRAFRERKERHVKELEAKLASLEATQAMTATENEQLKRDLQKMSTENEILKATSSMNGGAGSPGAAPQPVMGPLIYNPENFYTDLLANHDNKSPSHRVAMSAAGERLLAAGATWELIIGHELFKRGLVDVADVSNRLKNQARCDGQGPVFEEGTILTAIEQSVGSGSDKLL